MTPKFRNIERNMNYCATRWENNYNSGNALEAQKALDDYREQMVEAKKELYNMDPNSRDYDKAQVALDKQSAKLDVMQQKQNQHYQNQHIANDVEKFKQKNEELSRKMDDAIKKGDTKTYDSLKNQYDHNMKMQEHGCERLKANGYKYEDTLGQQRVDKLNHDIDMRNKVAEKVEKQMEKGKPVSEQDKANLEKYSSQVKKDEIETVKKQNEKIIQGMKERGASEEAIKHQQEENARSERWVESINR